MSRGRLQGTARRLAGLRRPLFCVAGALALALLAPPVSPHDDDKPGVPRAPASMPVSVGDGSITIRWNAPLEDGGFPITAYSFQWQEDGRAQSTFRGAFTDVGDPQPYEWTRSGLTNGGKYRFSVWADNGRHEGDPLNYYPVIPGSPDPPGDFRVNRKTGSEATLLWSEPDGNGAVVTGYEYEVVPAGGGGTPSWTAFDDDDVAQCDDGQGNFTECYTVSGLTAGTVYEIRLRAVNSRGAGLPTDPETAEAGTPDPPDDFRVIRKSVSEVILAWSEPDGNGAAVTGYEYEVDPAVGGGAPSWTAIDVALCKDGQGNFTECYTVSGLTAGTAYKFRMRALNIRGVGTSTDPETATAGTLREVGPPGLPRAPASNPVDVGDGSITIRWNAPLEDGGDPIVRYGFQWQKDGDTQTTFPGAFWNVGASQPYEYTRWGFTNGAKYRFGVRAENSKFDGDFLNYYDLIPGTPRVPGNFAITLESNGGVTLSWSEPDNNGAAITGYDYAANAVGATSTAWNSITAADVSKCTDSEGNARECYTVSGLTMGTAYEFRIRGKNSRGAGPPTDARTGTPRATPDRPVPEHDPSGHDEQALLHWAPPANNGAAITGYQIQQRSREKSATSWPGWPTTWTDLALGDLTDYTTDDNRIHRSYTVTGLTNGKEYEFRIRAVNVAGPSRPACDPCSGSNLPYPTVKAFPAGKPISATTHVRWSPGDRSLTVGWIPPDPNGSPLTQYASRVWDHSGDLDDATCVIIPLSAPASVGNDRLQYEITKTGQVTVSGQDKDCPELLPETSGQLEELKNGQKYYAELWAFNGEGKTRLNWWVHEIYPRPELGISDAASAVWEGESASKSLEFAVTQSAPSKRAVTVKYRTGDPSDTSLAKATAGDDYTAISDTTLTFAANATGDDLTQKVTVQIKDDTVDEDEEHLAVELHTPTDAVITDDEGIGTIRDDEGLTDICARTDQVKTAILAATPTDEPCQWVDPAELAAITSLTIGPDNNLTALKSGDFAGMTGLEELVVKGNSSLSGLPSDLFAPLSALTELNLQNNAFTALPGALTGLSALAKGRIDELFLGGNPFAPYSGISLTDLTGLDILDVPTFDAATISDRTWAPGTAISDVTLPAAQWGDTPYTYTLTTGTFPPGLSFNAATRKLTGTPTTPGEHEMTYVVQDNSTPDASHPDRATLTFTILIDVAPSFANDAAVADQTYVKDEAIAALELPEATGGNGDLNYALACAAGTSGCATDSGLPPGLSFDADDRELEGTPTTSGTYAMEYAVTDADGNVAASDADTLTFTITVEDDVAPSFGTKTVDDQTVVAQFAMADFQLPEATDGNGTLTYALACAAGATGCTGIPALPPGLSFDAATRTLSGTPTATGTTSLTYTVTDSDANTATTDTDSLTFDITVENDAAPSFGTETVDDQTVVAQFSMEDLQLPEATDGNGTLTYALECATGATGCTGTPALPPGLSFDVATRTLGGTPTATGTTSLTYTVTDSDANTTATDADTLTFDITVENDAAPSFGTQTVADLGEVAQIAMADLVLPAATGGNGTLTYALACAAGATGCTGTPALPPGLSFDAATRTLGGTPTNTGTTTLTYTVTDTDTNTAATDAAKLDFDITVDANQAPTADAGVAQTVLEGVTVTLDGSGSRDPEGQALAYAWTAPAGVTLSDTAAAAPTFTAPTLGSDADYTFTLVVNDGVQDSPQASVTIAVEVDVAPSFGTQTVADLGEVAQIAMADLVLPAATGGNGTLTYALACAAGSAGCTGTPALPPGLSFDAATRTLGGTPTNTGTTTLTYIVTDTDTNTAATDADLLTFDIKVENDAAPSFGTETVADQTAVAHIAISDLVLPEATDGNGTLTYALACAAGATGCTGTPALPPGLSFDVATRTLGGAPTAIGTTSLTYTVTDADTNTGTADTDSLGFDITVDANQAPTAVAGTAQTVVEGDTVTLDGSGSRDPEGQALAYAWTAPAGVTLSDTSAAAPTFTAPTLGSDADYTFTLVVNDGVQDSPQASVTIAVEVDVSPSFGMEMVDDQRYTENFVISDLVLPKATEGNGTLTYALACAAGATGCTGTPALPPGLSFDEATRTLSGTPTVIGTTSMTYTVTDADDNTATSDTDTLSFDITVGANQAPIADAGPDRTVFEGVTVTLDGSGSSDPEGQALSYDWDPPPGAVLGNADQARPSFTAPAVDSDKDFEFTLEVSDGVHTSAPDSVTITVEDDVVPSFGTETVSDQTYTETIAITTLELPEATGGNGALTYALACATGTSGCTGTPALPPGLSFDADDRELMGTPGTPGTYSMEYTARDADANTAATDAARLTFTITVQTAEPGPPGNFAAAGGHGEVTLTWSPPAHTGTSAILRYEYEQDGGVWTAITNSAPGEANAASWTVAGLDNGRTYAFRLRAVNGAGAGAPTNSVTAAMAPGRPDAPGLAAGNEALMVTWTAPAGDGGSAVTAYDVRYRKSGASTWTTVDNAWTSGTLEYTIGSLVNHTATDDTAYEVQVRAVNAQGDGAWSATSTARAGPPGKPAIGTIESGDGQLTVSWNAPAWGGVATSYDLRHRPAGGIWTTVDPAWTSGTHEYTIGSLVNGTAYEVEVRAVNGAGDGPWSDTATETPATVPGKPAITAVTPRDEALKLKWSAPSSDGGWTITRYEIAYRKTTESNWETVDFDWQPGKALTTTIDGLTNGVDYWVTIRAWNGQGYGPWSDTLSGTPSKSAPDAPAKPGITAVDAHLTVSWSPPDYDGGSPITAYDVRYRKHPCLESTVFLRLKGIFSCLIPSVSPGFPQRESAPLATTRGPIPRQVRRSRRRHSPAWPVCSSTSFRPPQPVGAGDSSTVHVRSSRSKTLARITSLRMTATSATLWCFPRAFSRSYKAFNSGLYFVAAKAAMYRTSRGRRRPPRICRDLDDWPLSCA